MELSKDDEFLNNVDIVFDPEKDIRTRSVAKQNIKSYLIGQLTKCVKDQTEECHETMKDILEQIEVAMLKYDSRYTNVIKSFVYDDVFQQLAKEVIDYLPKKSKGIAINADQVDRYKLFNSLLNLPTEVFGDDWTTILDAQGVPHTKKATITERKSISTGFQVPKSEGSAPVKRVARPTELARPVIGPFALDESYNKDFSRTWKSQWNSEMLLFEPRDVGIADKWLIKSFFDVRTYMTNTIFELNRPILDDLIIMIQEIQFWITSFFSDILTPCTQRQSRAYPFRVKVLTLFRYSKSPDCRKKYFVERDKHGQIS